MTFSELEDLERSGEMNKWEARLLKRLREKLDDAKRLLMLQGEETKRLNEKIDAAKKPDPRDGNGESKYARKHAYCAANGCWGWEVPFPKARIAARFRVERKQGTDGASNSLGGNEG